MLSQKNNSCTLCVPMFSFCIESPKSYISEDAGSPCSVDPNAMDVDSVGPPPTMVNLPCKLTWCRGWGGALSYKKYVGTCTF